jgi:hypothetical protein
MANLSQGLLTFLADNLSSQSPVKAQSNSQNEPAPDPPLHQYQSIPNTESIHNINVEGDSKGSSKGSAGSQRESSMKLRRTPSLEKMRPPPGSVPSAPHQYQTMPSSKLSEVDEVKPQVSLDINGEEVKLSRKATSPSLSSSPIIEQQRRRSVRLKRTKSSTFIYFVCHFCPLMSFLLESSIALGDLLEFGFLEVLVYEFLN